MDAELAAAVRAIAELAGAAVRAIAELAGAELVRAALTGPRDVVGATPSATTDLLASVGGIAVAECRDAANGVLADVDAAVFEPVVAAVECFVPELAQPARSSAAPNSAGRISAGRTSADGTSDDGNKTHSLFTLAWLHVLPLHAIRRLSGAARQEG